MGRYQASTAFFRFKYQHCLVQIVCICLCDPTTFTIAPLTNFGHFLATLRQYGSIPFEVSPTLGFIQNLGFACQSAFNGDPLSSSNRDPPPGGWDRWGGVRDPLLLSEVETTAQPDLFYADHPRLPFHPCTTKRSFCNQTRWVKLDADFPPSGSSLQAFPRSDVAIVAVKPANNRR